MQASRARFPATAPLTGDWQALVDPKRLAAWMDGEGLGGGGLSDFTPLTGGTQNILVRFDRDDRSYVLRRPPRHPLSDGNVINRREARVLGALSGTAVPHPRLIARCDDPDILGAAFYLMEPIDGINATDGPLPSPHRDDPAIRRRMGLALVEGALAIGAVDIDAVGLADLGRPQGFLERQVPRWRGLLDSYAQFPRWTGVGAIAGLESVETWLAAHVPDHFSPGLLHGDYHLANALFRPDSGELAAIVDWEQCTIGDPLLDMGWIMATWPDPDGSGPASLTAYPWDGFPPLGDLIDHYRSRSPRDTAQLRWYAVLACFKLGLIVEGSHARACAGLAPKATGDRLHGACLRLFERASAWVDAWPL